MTLSLELGALCDPIRDQLLKQGYKISDADAIRLQDVADAINMLKLHGLLPDSVVHSSNQKLMKLVVKAVEANL